MNQTRPVIGGCFTIPDVRYSQYENTVLGVKRHAAADLLMKTERNLRARVLKMIRFLPLIRPGKKIFAMFCFFLPAGLYLFLMNVEKYPF